MNDCIFSRIQLYPILSTFFKSRFQDTARLSQCIVYCGQSSHRSIKSKLINNLRKDWQNICLMIKSS